MNPFLIVAIAVLFVAPLGGLRAQVPQLINYQGRVGVDGVNFDGSGQFKFAFVNAAGTTTYWSNDGSSTAGNEPATAVGIPVSKGLYSILLGDATQAHMTIVPATVFVHGDVHLRVWFSDGVKGFQQLTPDRRIAAVGYALMADSVSDGAITTAKLADGAVTSEKLAAGVVQTGNLATGAVGNAQLANSALTINAGTGLGGGGLVSLGGNLTLSNAGVLSLTGGGGISVDAGTGAITLGSNATSAGTAGAIVARDASGGFTAGTITAALNGNAATATTASSATNFTGTLAGDVTGSQSATAISDATVTGKALTGFTATTGTVAATDSILSAINKIDGNVSLRAPVASPTFTGSVTMPAGTASAAPLLLKTGTNLATATFGAVEFDGTNIFVTNNSASPTRKTVAFTDSIVTSTQIADGTITSAKLASGAAAANLSASGQSGVPSGGLVLATSENPSLVTAGYTLVSSTLGTIEWKSRWANSPPTARGGHTDVWTGSEMMVWGGWTLNSVENTGGRYNPTTNVWVPIDTTGAPTARNGHTAVWTGTEMIIWGGENSGKLNTGGRYNPTTNTWTAISMVDAPSARHSHRTIWTGSEMIVWGGYGSSGPLNTGGRYNPTTDTWTTITNAGAPTARYQHTSVWTGAEMIIWGGNNPVSDNYFNDGWRYNPTTDLWTQLSAINAPSSRISHSAVWTGSKMIIFGGYLGGGGGTTNTGALYNPLTDTWTATPSGIFKSKDHSAIWTGTEMIVWGGEGPSGSVLDTGGRFNPVSNTWTPTSRDAPAARAWHTAVWTGGEMLIWGGYTAPTLSANETWIYTPSRMLYLYQRP